MNAQSDWLKKAEIDYFQPFISVWLSFNGWYKGHYREITGDRNIINKIKEDSSQRNGFYDCFNSIMRNDDKNSISLKTSIEMLHFSLSSAELKYQFLENHIIGFNHVAFLINNKWQYDDYLLDFNKRVQKIKLEKIALIDDIFKICSAVLEFIYQIRCHLIHGTLEPNDNNHKVVRYAYEIMYIVMNKIK